MNSTLLYSDAVFSSIIGNGGRVLNLDGIEVDETVTIFDSDLKNEPKND